MPQALRGRPVGNARIDGGNASLEPQPQLYCACFLLLPTTPPPPRPPWKLLRLNAECRAVVRKQGRRYLGLDVSPSCLRSLRSTLLQQALTAAPLADL